MLRRAILVVLFISSLAFSQNPPPSDPQALSYAAKSIAAMTGGISISDVTLTGSVTWNGIDTGTATLMALGTGESRMDLALGSGTRTEIRDAQTGAARGKWINPDNSSGKIAFQNCQTDAAWFFPVLGSLAAGQDVVLSYVGPETFNGQQVQHLQSYVYAGSGPGAIQPTPEQLSTMDFYLDAVTLLPSVVVFNAHPDDDSSSNLVTEVDFSSYQQQNGLTIPIHVQRYFQGALTVDLSVTSAVFNTGLSQSTFQIN